jgi:2-dehydro-3-deoxyphosphogluconate aldolase/(4S)-4-hydroxy-2-oxoglutarate aldolase
MVAKSVLDLAPVIPVVTLDDPVDAVPVAAALRAGGVHVIEVTLRTGGGVAAIRSIVEEFDDMTVGAGTVCSPAQAHAAAEAGADFLVSPGFTDELLRAMQETTLDYLAGASSPSEMLRLVERGQTQAKFFPAGVGGVAVLQAVHGPLPELRFCATGGIYAHTAPDYLSLPNVGCVGGTWLAPQALIRAKDWSAIERLASASLALRP